MARGIVRTVGIYRRVVGQYHSITMVVVVAPVAQELGDIINIRMTYITVSDEPTEVMLSSPHSSVIDAGLVLARIR